MQIFVDKARERVQGGASSDVEGPLLSPVRRLMEDKKGHHPMKTDKSHRYLGRSILPCSYVESTQAGKRWYVERIHSATGIPYGEQDCKRVRSLDEAREYIRESAARDL